MMAPLRQWWILPGSSALALGALVLTLLGGCTRAIVKAPDPIRIDAREYSAVFDAAILVLRDEGFIINRKDYRFGVVNTRPFFSPSVFEPWHVQNTTSYQTLESTLNSERRTVEVTIQPAGPIPGVGAGAGTDAGALPGAPNPDYQLRVEVLIERHEFPVYQLSGSTSSYSVIDTYGGPSQLQTERGLAGTYWVPIAHDPYMEQQLISKIIKRSIQLAEHATTQPR
jgi:hypothetical protein